MPRRSARAQPLAAGPGLRAARRAPAALAAAQVAQGPAARGLPARVRAALARGGRRCRRSSGRRCGTTVGPITGRSTSSATSMAATTSSPSCCASSATQLGADGTSATPPDGRRAVFVGDYGDRGPDTPRVLRARHVDGRRRARPSACPATTTSSSSASSRVATSRSRTGSPRRLSSSKRESEEFRDEARDFLDRLVSHVVLDDGRLVVAHAGMKEAIPGSLAPGGSASSRCSARRPARPTSSGSPSAAVGGRVPRQRGGRLRPHAGRGSRSG